jgi:hypothetical protein
LEASLRVAQVQSKRGARAMGEVQDSLDTSSQVFFVNEFKGGDYNEFSI